MITPPAPIPSAPPWPHCAHGADPATDPVGCTGIHVPGHTACLAHLTDTDRNTYLASLAPGADIDHRGTHFTAPLLISLLHALRDPTTTNLHLGSARFDRAQFSGDAQFGEAQFSGNAQFGEAQFLGNAGFSRAQFSRNAGFDRAQFSGSAWFGEAQFSDDAGFERAQFSGNTGFDRARFAGDAQFGEAQFSGDTWFSRAQFFGHAGFSGTQFSRKAWFEQAQFSSDAWFERAQFSGDAGFSGAQFSGDAWFERAQLSGEARFRRAQFSGRAWFGEAQFSSDAWFSRARFAGDAQFGEAQFSGDAGFRRAQFSGDAGFSGAQFSGDARFAEARFAVLSWFGPVVCGRGVDLSGAVFEVPVTLEIAAREVLCVRARWESTATVRLRHASVDLSQAVLSFPVAVTAYPTRFTTGTGPVDEGMLAGSGGVRVASVQDVDAAHLVLTDTDLADCLFTGAFHLDQLRLEGRCTFAPAPTGWHRRGIWPVRWTHRRTLAEEHHWRAQSAGQPAPAPGQPPSPRAWRTGPHHPDTDLTPDPEDVVATYRQLRKAFEDGKNEPGAADFYYGEMEMRRHDPTGTPSGERGLLHGYWLLSGYGLRASRALGWLAAAMLVTIILLMGFGIPNDSPKQMATGTVPSGGGKVAFVIDKADPQNPTGNRFTSKRFDKALSLTLNSVVFRSSGQDLTTAGTYIEMTSRLLEPALLALAVLAVRGRIKR
ncbi:pentapeptide repeat-containing protein (plasmid) [Streptomyces avidinii]|uniref:pentapeptide repeat-containing protein n=1 Tax=Streptomyces avidinii TaxID=1895 RepID=UPI002F915D31|nr:pentapeptide repeat-containing protein [Streptomyces avidinii]